MEPEIFRRFQDYFNSGRIRKKQRLLLISIFLIVATFLWALNILGEEHITTIKYPVRYSNFPADKVLISKLPSSLSLKIRAQGFKILQYNFGSSLHPLRFDYLSFRSNKFNNSNNNKTFILTELTRERLANQLNEMEIITVSPDTLFFHFSVKKNKIVKVSPDINYQLEKQYMLAGKIIIDPDSIIITGPADFLDTINSVKTEIYRVNNIKKTVQKNLGILSLHNIISLSETKVNITIPVEKFTEKELIIPIEAENLPEGFSIRTFPGSIKLNFHVILSEFDKYEPGYFKAVVDYNSIEQILGNKLKVKIVKSPESIFLVGFSPAMVEYIIEK